MDIDSDASPRSSGNSTDTHRHRETPKTKGTCDRCALSKVKCDRQQPYCARCVAIGEDLGIPPPCHYTVSLRSLKRKNGRKKNSAGRPRSNTHSTTSTTTLPTPKLRPLDWTFMSSPMMPQDGSVDSTSEIESITPPALEELRLPTRHRHTKSEPFNQQGNMHLRTSTPDPTFMSYPQLLRKLPPQHTSETVTTHGRAGTEGNTQTACIDLVHSCIREMLPASCQSAQLPVPGSISLDRLLSINRRTIAVFNKVMSCSCTQTSGSTTFAIAYLLSTSFGFFRNAVASPLLSKHAVLQGQDCSKVPILRHELEKISKMADEFSDRCCREGDGDAVRLQLFKYSLSVELKKCLDVLDEWVSRGG